MSKLKIKNGNTWEEVPAGGVGVPSGGTQGQVLMKSSSTDYATGWGNVGTFESGTDGIWTYRKYSDRTYHAWWRGYVSLLVGTAWCGGYFHQTASAMTPPSFSVEVTSVSGFADATQLLAYVGHATDFSTYWFNGVSQAGSGYPVRIDMYGTW